MSLSSWFHSLFIRDTAATVYITVMNVLPATVSPLETVFCFAADRKTLLSQPGVIPERLADGERCAVLPAEPLWIEVEHDDKTYRLRLKSDPDNYLAAFLGKHGRIDDALLATIARNAVEAVLSGSARPYSSEPLRARISNELLLSGFRCVELSETATVRPPVPEPSVDAHELAADLDALRRAGAALPGGGASAAAAASGTGGDPAARARSEAAELERRLREYRRDLADARSIESRLDIPLTRDSIPREERTGVVNPVEVTDIPRPFTALVLRRSDIDVKLRAYVDELLAGALSMLAEYRERNLGRDFRSGAKLLAAEKKLELCRDRLAGLRLLRHDVRAVRPNSGEVRKRVRLITSAAAGAEGARGAATFLCGVAPGGVEFEQALGDVLAAAENLDAVLADASRI